MESYVRVKMYQREGNYKIPLFKDVLVGWEQFLKLEKAGIVFRVGASFGMFA